MVFTFWEGTMPEYIKLCLETWHFDFTVLDYSNLKKYTDLRVTDELKRFTLPQIADCVRAHVLRDNGGYWLDTDTISITGKLPVENVIGNIDTREHHIGYLHTEANSDMFVKWAEYQDKVLADPNASHKWNIMGNAFTDIYVKEHGDIKIHPTGAFFPEIYMEEKGSRWARYDKFYFKMNYELSDITKPSDLFLLHNSWTPEAYKRFSKEEVLGHECTLSNILKELL